MTFPSPTIVLRFIYLREQSKFSSLQLSSQVVTAYLNFCSSHMLKGLGLAWPRDLWPWP